MVNRTYTYIDTECEVASYNYYGVAMKQMVSALLSMCTELTVYSVVTNTNSVYNVVLTCMNSEFKIFFKNSSDTMYWGIVDSAGTQHTISSQGVMLEMVSDSSTGTTKYRAKFRIQRASIGNFMYNLRISNMAYNPGYYCLDVMYLWAKSAELNANVYFYNGEGVTGTGAGYSFTSSPLNLSSVHVYQPSVRDGYFTGASLHSPGLPGYVASQSLGVPYNLTPEYLYGSHSGSNKVWFGHLLWGGLYDLYLLRNSSGSAVSVQPDMQYVIDNLTYWGCFRHMYIPEPAIFT